MKIELKAFKHIPEMSEETNAFRANLYIQGKLTAHTKNYGYGGCTDYTTSDTKTATKQRLKDAEVYCRDLPRIVTDLKIADGTMFSYEQSLESVIDNLVLKKLREQEAKRLTQWFRRNSGKDSIMFQTKQSEKDSWETMAWRKEIPPKVRVHLFKENLPNNATRFFNLVTGEIEELGIRGI